MYYSMQYAEDELVKLKSKKEELWKEISAFDKQLSDAYHRLEAEEMNKEASFKFTKELQIVVRNRRKVKFEASQVESLIHHFHNIKQKLEANEKKYFEKASNYKEYIYNN